LNYASLYFATRTQDPVAKALLDRVRNRYTEVRNRLVPLEVALRKLPEEAFQALLEHPGLADLRHFLQRQRAFAPHTLSEREEELLNLKGLVGRSAWSQFYTEYTGRFRFRVGERELTEMEVRALRRDPDPKVRREAHRELYGKLMAEAPTLSAVFNAVFLDYLQDLRLRGYHHPLEPVALRDEVEVKDIEALLEATQAHYPLVEAYYRWKARRLGLEKTPSPDLLAPLAKEKPKVPFEEAQDLVLTAFHRFSPRWEGSPGSSSKSAGSMSTPGRASGVGPSVLAGFPPPTPTSSSTTPTTWTPPTPWPTSLGTGCTSTWPGSSAS